MPLLRRCVLRKQTLGLHSQCEKGLFWFMKLLEPHPSSRPTGVGRTTHSNTGSYPVENPPQAVITSHSQNIYLIFIVNKPLFLLTSTSHFLSRSPKPFLHKALLGFDPGFCRLKLFRATRGDQWGKCGIWVTYPAGNGLKREQNTLSFWKLKSVTVGFPIITELSSFSFSSKQLHIVRTHTWGGYSFWNSCWS